VFEGESQKETIEIELEKRVIKIKKYRKVGNCEKFLM
jgi:hypothetical protein